MESWSEEDRQRNLRTRSSEIPPEFGGDPVKGVSGKKYEQMEFDFGKGDTTPDFLRYDQKTYEAKQEKYIQDHWVLKNNVCNTIMQVKGIIDSVMDSMGHGGGSSNDTYEYALWGASELLQNAIDLLE